VAAPASETATEIPAITIVELSPLVEAFGATPRVMVAGPLPVPAEAVIQDGNPDIVQEQPAVVWMETL